MHDCIKTAALPTLYCRHSSNQNGVNLGLYFTNTANSPHWLQLRFFMPCTVLAIAHRWPGCRTGDRRSSFLPPIKTLQETRTKNPPAPQNRPSGPNRERMGHMIAGLSFGPRHLSLCCDLGLSCCLRCQQHLQTSAHSTKPSVPSACG